MNYRPVMSNMPPVVKNLIIINVLFLLATWVLQPRGIDLVEFFGMHYPESEKFKLHQIITHMFMHSPSGIAHIFFNMFALWMFGQILENVWGPKRFLIYYLITGIGAGIIQMLVTEIRIQSLITDIDPQLYEMVIREGLEIKKGGQNFVDPIAGELNNLINTSTVGASGAVFGILLAFGMLFPNARLMLLIPPVPIKAKYMVMIYGALELYLGISNNPADNVAHFAHLGGMLFGFFLIKMWKSPSDHNNF